MELRRSSGRALGVGTLVVDERVDDLLGQLARAAATASAPRRTAATLGIGHVGGPAEVIDAVGVERIALQPFGGEEEGR